MISVENIFDFSFLLKEGKTTFQEDPKPTDEPIVRVSDFNDQEQKTQNQMVLAFSYEDYKKMVEAKNIKKCKNLDFKRVGHSNRGIGGPSTEKIWVGTSWDPS